MSITFGIFCRDCAQSSPPIGDGGYIGAPTLHASPQHVPELGDEPLPTFGFLYEPLAGIGLRTYQCERLRDWLSQHGGHRIALYHAQEPPELEAVRSRGLEWRRERVLEVRRQESAARAALESGAFRRAQYSARCDACGAAVVSPEPETIVPFEPFALRAPDVAAFLERWAPIIKHNVAWVHRLMEIVDPDQPFLGELSNFLRDHQSHAVHALLIGDGTA